MSYMIETYDDAIEYITSGTKPDFDAALRLGNAILADPQQYTGPQAMTAALKLATHRYQIGLEAQHWKLRSSQTKKLQDRLIKDALMTAYDGLFEVINCLKLQARQDHSLANSR